MIWWRLAHEVIALSNLISYTSQRSLAIVQAMSTALGGLTLPPITQSGWFAQRARPVAEMGYEDTAFIDRHAFWDGSFLS